MATLLPKLAVPAMPFEPLTLAPGAAEVWLEIGFGGGEHLAAQALDRPGVLMIGAETFVDGVASLLRHVEAEALSNVRIHAGDGRTLMDMLPPASIDRLFVLFPDPWPKTRHRGRRLIQGLFVQEAARIMKPGARALFATDWADYAESMLADLLASPDFTWTAQSADDWRNPPAAHTATRYQIKRLGDCAPIWLEFERI
jgi:tRNA (guanine-N7-)-methyltransferase